MPVQGALFLHDEQPCRNEENLVPFLCRANHAVCEHNSRNMSILDCGSIGYP